MCARFAAHWKRRFPEKRTKLHVISYRSSPDAGIAWRWRCLLIGTLGPSAFGTTMERDWVVYTSGTMQLQTRWKNAYGDNGDQWLETCKRSTVVKVKTPKYRLYYINRARDSIGRNPAWRSLYIKLDVVVIRWFSYETGKIRFRYVIACIRLKRTTPDSTRHTTLLYCFRNNYMFVLRENVDRKAIVIFFLFFYCNSKGMLKIRRGRFDVTVIFSFVVSLCILMSFSCFLPQKRSPNNGNVALKISDPRILRRKSGVLKCLIFKFYTPFHWYRL